MNKKISILLSAIIVSFIGLTVDGVKAAIEGALTVTSSNPGVLSVEALPDGTYQITVVTVGTADITVSSLDAAGNPITTTFNYEVYDPAVLANHFDETIVSQTLRVTPASAAADATNTTETSGSAVGTADPAKDAAA